LNILLIDKDRCKGCGICVEVCPKEILYLDNDVINTLGYHPIAVGDGCIACGFCATLCPDVVFSIYKGVREGDMVGKAVDERE
jgi:2-oxoglutarate ferredoxin oxidoreductase subunit delta